MRFNVETFIAGRGWISLEIERFTNPGNWPDLQILDPKVKTSYSSC